MGGPAPQDDAPALTWMHVFKLTVALAVAGTSLVVFVDALHKRDGGPKQPTNCCCTERVETGITPAFMGSVTRNERDTPRHDPTSGRDKEAQRLAPVVKVSPVQFDQHRADANEQSHTGRDSRKNFHRPPPSVVDPPPTVAELPAAGNGSGQGGLFA